MLIKLKEAVWVDPSAVVTVVQKYDFTTPGQTPEIKKQCQVFVVSGPKLLDYLIDELAETVSTQVNVALGHV
jgi:hypothetical protein